MAEFESLYINYPWVFYSGVFVFSLLVGSFLNVVIYRLPIMMERGWGEECREFLKLEPTETQEKFNLLVPRSKCPHCGHQISSIENIPLLSYLLQKGKCRHCGAGISAQYPLIELMTGLLTVWVVVYFGYSLQSLFAVFLTWSLIALAIIDLRTTYLPDSITLPLLWAGLLINQQGVFVDINSSLYGAVAGYLSLWSIYHLFKLLTGKEGMGHGDFKLLAALGAWLGWQSLVSIILLSSIAGAIIGISLIIVKGRDKNIPIPFGPYLAIAGFLTLVWGDRIERLFMGGSGLG